MSLRMEEHSENNIVPFICLILFLSAYQQLRAQRLQGTTLDEVMDKPAQSFWGLSCIYIYFYIFHKFSFLLYNSIN